MVTVFESIMLVCFGISWPISVYKSATSKSTKGKSVLFTFAIIIGYMAGIDTCWFNPKHAPNTLKIPVTYEIESLSELSDIL